MRRLRRRIESHAMATRVERRTTRLALLDAAWHAGVDDLPDHRRLPHKAKVGVVVDPPRIHANELLYRSAED